MFKDSADKTVSCIARRNVAATFPGPNITSLQHSCWQNVPILVSVAKSLGSLSLSQPSDGFSVFMLRTEFQGVGNLGPHPGANQGHRGRHSFRPDKPGARCFPLQ